jgi:hypothetical protein
VEDLVYARVSGAEDPDEGAARGGQFVAMTGDGVNVRWRFSALTLESQGLTAPMWARIVAYDFAR